MSGSGLTTVFVLGPRPDLLGGKRLERKASDCAARSLLLPDTGGLSRKANWYEKNRNTQKWKGAFFPPGAPNTKRFYRQT